MKKIAIIFPHQLFAEHPALSATRDVHLVEDRRFFTDFRFHKKKLLFHRESMHAYKEDLVTRGYRVRHIRQRAARSGSYLTELLSRQAVEDIYAADPCDRVLMWRLQKICQQHRKRLHISESPSFVTSEKVLEDFFKNRKSLSMACFYISQRRRLGILVKKGKPVGGRWSFDPANRKRLPRGFHIPQPKKARTTPSERSISDIQKEYRSNPGGTADFIFPITHRDARLWLKDFVANRLRYFGDYEDAISTRSVFVFHSVLSPLLNTGLLTPMEVLDNVLAVAERGEIPINSLEGFARQIIGWREFMRGAYIFLGEKQRRSNFWNCSNKLPKAFYDGTTGMEPVDAIIRRVLHNSYCHHIERLMILGNFMLLCEIHPDEVYRWFMELFIDAYDWVMVPNVYGMSQYADGGLITSKPYISSSNYVKKMSGFGTGLWCNIWDALFWRFVQKHRKVFADNARMRIMTMQLQRMDKKKIREHTKTAEKFLVRLFS
ncbi:MAG: cryptochrome/photolyase family protein [Phycisphaerales bacterium]|nr:MAG: cryptochrome/photolyase family protein [Phycisphaerales bacterium]